MDKLIVIARSDLKEISEGGASRDSAIVEFLAHYAEDIKFLNKRNPIDLLRFVKLLIGSSGKTILLFYPFVGWPYAGTNFFRYVLREIGILLIFYAGKRHTLLLDISDLPEFQSIDLGLDATGNISRFERTIFKAAAKLFIASPGFGSAIFQRYEICPEKMIVCLNGGPSVDIDLRKTEKKSTETGLIECVYAGTLTRGRSIEEMICQFENLNKVKLHLIGSDGEWLADVNLPANVIYHGRLEQADAIRFCASCDLGLIPYDESKYYYNICYPTKAGFYVSAGIPFLSTPCEQIQKIAGHYNIGFWASLSNWNLLLDSLTHDDIAAEKNNIVSVADKFSWKTIISESYGKFFANE